MALRISFLTPHLPPAVCGVGDHTKLLADAMVAQGAQVAFVHRLSPPADEHALPGPVAWWSGGNRQLRAILQRQNPDWLWVQFTCYGYHYYGLTYWLGRTLGAIRRALPRLRIAICAHEIHYYRRQLGRKGRLLCLSWFQKHGVRSVLRHGDVILASPAQFLDRIHREYGIPQSRIAHLPIGSNIACRCLSVENRQRIRRQLGWGQERVLVTFGSYVSQLRSLEACRAVLAQGVQTGRVGRIVCIGGDGQSIPAEFSRWASTLGGHKVFEVLGHGTDEQVADVLSAADFAFSQYPPSLLGKSGAFAAFALAGLPVLVPSGTDSRSPDESLPFFIEAETWDWSEADRFDLEAVHRSIGEFACKSYSWNAIGRSACQVLVNRFPERE